MGGTFSGKWDAPEGNGTTLAAQLNNLREGRAYVNFHTRAVPAAVRYGVTSRRRRPRDSLVAGLNGATLTRAQVLRAVAEAEEMQTREFNAAFVAMQYFGYLRRDPDTAGFQLLAQQAELLQWQLPERRDGDLLDETGTHHE